MQRCLHPKGNRRVEGKGPSRHGNTAAPLWNLRRALTVQGERDINNVERGRVSVLPSRSQPHESEGVFPSRLLHENFTPQLSFCLISLEKTRRCRCRFGRHFPSSLRGSCIIGQSHRREVDPSQGSDHSSSEKEGRANPRAICQAARRRTTVPLLHRPAVAAH